MPWFYNSESGELTHADGIDAVAYELALHTGTGWHELKIPDSATATQAAAEAAKEVPGGTSPTTSIATGLGNAATDNPITRAAGIAGTKGGFFGAITGFLGALTDITTWRSLAWIFLGTILVIAGIYLWLKDAGLIPETTPVPIPVPI